MIPSIFMRYLMEQARWLVTTWPSAIVALAAWISIVAYIDPAGSYPSMPQGPGLTVDEIFNVEQGVYLVEQARALGWYNLIPGTSSEAFLPENGCNPDHPPLGRYWLGVHHQLVWWIAPPDRPEGPFVTACARIGSATAFALTVWMVGAFATFITSFGPEKDSRWLGPLTSCALVLMPRVYGHAHLAALETATNLTCTAAVLALAAWWRGASVPTSRNAFLAGVVMGLAMLTKVQAILIPIPVIVWALVRWRQRAIVPLMCWGLTAIAVFFIGWPYLWWDPVGHLLEYLGRTTNRVTLYCFYFGTRFADKEVPWHYPFVMFAVTVPVVLQLSGLWGAWTGLTKSKVPSIDVDVWAYRLIMGCSVFPLVVFALPGVAVYDGERLFLTVFPLWAIFIGIGTGQFLDLCATRYGSWAAKGLLCAVLAAQACSNSLVHPVYLSYYNLVVGGTSGAEKLGFEMSYWGDALTREVLEQAAAKGPYGEVTVVPSLHQFQSADLMLQSPILRQQRKSGAGSLSVAFRRRADVSDELFRTFKNDPYHPLAGFRKTP